MPRTCSVTCSALPTSVWIRMYALTISPPSLLVGLVADRSLDLPDQLAGGVLRLPDRGSGLLRDGAGNLLGLVDGLADRGPGLLGDGPGVLLGLHDHGARLLGDRAGDLLGLVHELGDLLLVRPVARALLLFRHRSILQLRLAAPPIVSCGSTPLQSSQVRARQSRPGSGGISSAATTSSSRGVSSTGVRSATSAATPPSAASTAEPTNSVSD